MSEACKPCDGRGRVRRKTEDGFEESKNPCSACGGSGVKPGPSKGGRRFGRKPKEEKTPEEMTLEEQTRAFLRSRGH